MAGKQIQRGFSIHPDNVDALSHIYFILVGLTHPGNIGASARVMKNMGLKNLTLVSCVDAGPETEAYPLASGAYDLVEQASIFPTLEEALKDFTMSIGTSGRLGGKRVYAGTPEQLCPEILANAKMGKTAVVFGRESRGLTNEELKLCTHHLIIPTDGAFASMNVSTACAIAAYEIFKLASRPTGFQTKKLKPAEIAVREQMYGHIEEILLQAGFLQKANPLIMMRDIRRILNSADMDDRDVKIIRGIFRKIGNYIRIQKADSNQEK